MSVLYFAYGSNMLPWRLQRRCSGARLVGTAALEGFGLSFSKIGRDGSGKATVHVANRPEARVHGVVFELARHEIDVLDRIEGRGQGYERIEALDARLAGVQAVSVTTYMAHAPHIDASLDPFDWYLDLVVYGALHSRLPDAYCRMLAETRALSDPEPERASRREALAVLAEAGLSPAIDQSVS